MDQLDKSILNSTFVVSVLLTYVDTAVSRYKYKEYTCSANYVRDIAKLISSNSDLQCPSADNTNDKVTKNNAFDMTGMLTDFARGSANNIGNTLQGLSNNLPNAKDLDLFVNSIPNITFPNIALPNITLPDISKFLPGSMFDLIFSYIKPYLIKLAVFLGVVLVVGCAGFMIWSYAKRAIYNCVVNLCCKLFSSKRKKKPSATLTYGVRDTVDPHVLESLV